MITITDEWADDTTNDLPGTPAPTTPAAAKRPARSKAGGAGPKTTQPQPPELVFQNVEQFVTEYLAPTIRRNINGVSLTWCPTWWRHPEALSRLTAMWRAWENLRQDPAVGISNWWLHHADPHLRALLDGDTGPFSACSPEGHSEYPYAPLPVEAADPAMWLSPAFSAAPKPTDTNPAN